MGKQSINEALGRVYRQFSRQKYNKYKAQFPKLRESDIVNKIIKEWDALDINGKEHLSKLYEEKNFLTNEDISSSEALKNAERANKEARIAAEQSARAATKAITQPRTATATKLHSNIRVVERDQSDFNRGSEFRSESRRAQSSEVNLVIKNKPISKSSHGDYITFFKKYYQSLRNQHSRWTTQQIASTIKLLWKKKKSQGKSLRKTDGRLRTSKPLSGRIYFRKVKNLDGLEAKIKWRMLPFEVRNYWKYESLGILVDNTRVSDTFHLRPENTFSFLSKTVV